MVKLLIVDDDMVTRFYLRTLVDRHPEITIVGEAESGVEAVKMAQELKPDVISMDVNMPEMDGLEATRRIMSSSHRPPIIMVSDITQADSKATVTALSLGAVDFLSKSLDRSGGAPGEENASLLERVFGYKFDIPHVEKELVNKVLHWAANRACESQSKSASPTPTPVAAPVGATTDLILITASSGSIYALPGILTTMGMVKSPVIMVHNLPFVDPLLTLLQSKTKMKVENGGPGMVLQPGVIHLIPESSDIILRQDASNRLLLDLAPPQSENSSSCPLIESATKATRKGMAVVLSGVSQHVAGGAAVAFRQGWAVLAQDPKTCIPDAVYRGILSGKTTTEILSPEKIGERLAKWAG